MISPRWKGDLPNDNAKSEDGAGWKDEGETRGCGEVELRLLTHSKRNRNNYVISTEMDRINSQNRNPINPRCTLELAKNLAGVVWKDRFLVNSNLEQMIDDIDED